MTVVSLDESCVAAILGPSRPPCSELQRQRGLGSRRERLAGMRETKRHTTCRNWDVARRFSLCVGGKGTACGGLCGKPGAFARPCIALSLTTLCSSVVRTPVMLDILSHLSSRLHHFPPATHASHLICQPQTNANQKLIWTWNPSSPGERLNPASSSSFRPVQ